MMNMGSGNKATIIGVVARSGSCIVTLFGVVFGLFKHYQKKKTRNKQLPEALSQISAPDTESTQTHSYLIEPTNPNTSTFVITGGLGDVWNQVRAGR
jgi:hypothetical protein